MANAYESVQPAPSEPKLVFSGTQRNLAAGISMLIAGILAFSMKLTDVFFAEATAWTFVLWGALFIYVGLMDFYQTYEVTDEALIIRNPLRPWTSVKVFDWAHLHRLDLIVRRVEAKPQDVEMQIYYTPEGEIAIDREDRMFDPELARLIIERANLLPTDPSNPAELTTLPQVKATYIWNKSGRITAAS
jgi:hypothetical protein